MRYIRILAALISVSLAIWSITNIPAAGLTTYAERAAMFPSDPSFDWKGYQDQWNSNLSAYYWPLYADVHSQAEADWLSKEIQSEARYASSVVVADDRMMLALSIGSLVHPIVYFFALVAAYFSRRWWQLLLLGAVATVFADLVISSLMTPALSSLPSPVLRWQLIWPHAFSIYVNAWLAYAALGSLRQPGSSDRDRSLRIEPSMSGA